MSGNGNFDPNPKWDPQWNNDFVDFDDDASHANVIENGPVDIDAENTNGALHTFSVEAPIMNDMGFNASSGMDSLHPGSFQNPTVNGMAFVAPSDLDRDFNQLHSGTFLDQPMFNTLPTQNNYVQHTPNVLPAQVAQGTVSDFDIDWSFVDSKPFQTTSSQQMPNIPPAQATQGNSSPIDFSTEFADNADVNNDVASPYVDADQQIRPQAYPSYDPFSSQNPTPPPEMPANVSAWHNFFAPQPGRKEYKNLEAMLQTRQTGPADVNADRLSGGAQPLPIDNDLLSPHPQSGAPTISQVEGFAPAVGVEGPVQDAAPSKGKGKARVTDAGVLQPLRTLAPRPTPGLGVATVEDQDDDDEEHPVTSPVIPVKKESKKSKKPTSKNKKSTAKAKQEAVKVPVYSDQLLISTMDEANEVGIKRIPLEVVDDDRNEVAAQAHIWVPKITKAFEADFRKLPRNNAKITDEGREEFTRWQKEHENKVWAIFNEQKDVPKFAQACAYIFFNLVLKAHEPGKGLIEVAKTISNGGANTTMKCSQRLDASIKALEEYSIVKFDFLKQDRLDGLAASPRGFVARKVENMFVNYKKKKGTGPVKVEEKVKTEESEGKSKRKRKDSSPLPSETEEETPFEGGDDDEDDEADDESEEEVETPTKRTRIMPRRR